MLRIAIGFVLLTTAPATALDRDFLGTWAPDAGSCAFADSTARFTITPDRMVGREFACTLKSASQSGPIWRMRYACIGEGEDYPLDVEWRLGADGHLLEKAERQSSEYMRCR